MKDSTFCEVCNKFLQLEESITAPKEPPNLDFVSQFTEIIQEFSGFEDSDQEKKNQEWL